MGNGAKAEMLVLQGFFGSFNAVNYYPLPITYYQKPVSFWIYSASPI
jgi:hypothetical protein